MQKLSGCFEFINEEKIKMARDFAVQLINK